MRKIFFKLLLFSFFFLSLTSVYLFKNINAPLALTDPNDPCSYVCRVPGSSLCQACKNSQEEFTSSQTGQSNSTASESEPDIAAVPEPTVICLDDNPDAWRNPEFHSQRPYQASPCHDSPKAYMCSNIINVKLETVRMLYNPALCDENGLCQFNRGPQTKRVVISLSGVDLPILGNTQDVINSQNAVETLSDADKMNEYVAWYLSGATHKAEYGVDDFTKLVNFSGPLKKLLPGAIQDYIRLDNLWNSGVKPVEYIDAQGNEIRRTNNHNQIAVCTTRNFLGIDNPWIGDEKPTPCYSGDGGGAQGSFYRLNDWWDSKNSPFSTLLNWFGAGIWNYRVPPFPWQFTKNIYYQKAYREWRGFTCVLVGDKYGCLDDPTRTNRWADLYSYIPTSNTVDKVGKQTINTPFIGATNGTIEKDYESSVAMNASLYYPHTAAVSENLVYLNNTFVPKEGVETRAIPAQTEDSTSECVILDARSNPGDDLTFTNSSPRSYFDFSVTYNLSEIQCERVEISNAPLLPPEDLEGFNSAWKCETDVYTSFGTSTVAPYLSNIWKDSVAGAGSTFRRIFPKVDTGSPVTCIADIPGSSAANFNLSGQSSGGVSISSIRNPGGSPAQNPEIYFPHLGSVYEYFLKGIQSALRPLGFGNGVVDGTLCKNNLQCGVLPELPTNAECSLSNVSPRVGTIPPSFRAIIESASSTYNIPPNLLIGVLYGEGVFSGRFDWTEENVIAWASCEGIPRCDPSANAINTLVNPIFKNNWDNIATQIQADLRKIDPNRITPDPCNLLDVTFGLAKILSTGKNGSPEFAGQTCYGIDLNAGFSQGRSCTDWSDNDIETSIRTWTFGTAYNDVATCATLEGSCRTGGGFAAACPEGDNCEKVDGGTRTSHNACVWDVTMGRR